jgi:tetraacyldisaccharide 4'-kinase
MKKIVARDIFFKPFSQLWESAYRLRRLLYEYGIFKKDYYRVPIISVGNITFGGTGKTPMIIWLVKKLENYGCSLFVLTRGYKGNLEHKAGIIKGGQRFLTNPMEYGDEPLLISKNMKKGAVVVGKRRSENLRHFFPSLEPDAVLLDDGFQHLKLYRSLNIVLFDALLPLKSYRVAPLGYLREGLTSLKDADAILISRADQASEEKLEALLNLIKPYHPVDIPIGKLGYVAKGLYDCFEEEVHNLEYLQERNIIALTAIASPESFYQMLEKYGANIVKKMVYPDHHFFTHQDINDILKESITQDALVITSEKDMVKIKKVTRDNRILSLNIDIKFYSGEAELLSQIRSILNLDYV